MINLQRLRQKRIDPWCNGSTPVFGTVSQGSSPCGSTKRGNTDNSLIASFLFADLYMMRKSRYHSWGGCSSIHQVNPESPLALSRSMIWAV